MTKQRRQHIAAIARHIRLFVTILQGLLRKNDFICATQHVLVLEEANSTQSSVLREGMNPLRGRNSGRKEGHGKRLLLDHAMLENGEETTIWPVHQLRHRHHVVAVHSLHHPVNSFRIHQRCRIGMWTGIRRHHIELHLDKTLHLLTHHRLAMGLVNLVPLRFSLSFYTGATKETNLHDIATETASGRMERRCRPYTHGWTHGFVRCVV